MPEGTPFSDCAGGYVEERINGQLVNVIPLNDAGALQEQKVSNKEIIACAAAFGGTVVSVVTLSGGIGWVGLGFSLVGIATCRS